MSARHVAILIFGATWASLSILDAVIGISRLNHPFVAALYAIGFWCGTKWQREAAQ